MKMHWDWKTWLVIFLLLFIMPGGVFILVAWLLCEEVKLDKDLTAYYHDSFAEFMRKNREKEDGNDIHAKCDQ